MTFLGHVSASLARQPRRVFAGLAALCAGMFAFSLYLQHGFGLEPCPMCIVQRFAMAGVGLLAALAAFFPQRAAHIVGVLAWVLLAGFGAYTAARQSWLQWYPPEILSCGRDLYSMLASFPLNNVMQMVFRGTGDCSKVESSLLGLTTANWSFLVFSGIVLLGLWLFWGLLRRR